MWSKHCVFATLAGLALFLFPGAKAEADTITYAFSVTATAGPLNGTVANGTFSFDSSSITPGATNSDANLLTDLAFTWDGILYDDTTANTGFLTFNPSGVLTSATFGNNCSPGTCLVTMGLENWWVSHGAFDYSISGNVNAFAGTVTMTQTPEPSAVTMLLTGLGLFIVGLRISASRTASYRANPKM